MLTLSYASKYFYICAIIHNLCGHWNILCHVLPAFFHFYNVDVFFFLLSLKCPGQWQQKKKSEKNKHHQMVCVYWGSAFILINYKFLSFAFVLFSCFLAVAGIIRNLCFVSAARAPYHKLTGTERVFVVGCWLENWRLLPSICCHINWQLVVVDYWNCFLS